ncbi:MBL fold metallo-hydrolase [Flavitalea flava]
MNQPEMGQKDKNHPTSGTDNIKVCTTCGTQFPAGDNPKICSICADDRQYIPEGGQGWTTPGAITKRHSVRILALSEQVYDLMITPTFGIGQRALLVTSEKGNILWDCIPLLNEPTIEFIRSKGGLQAIAFSHPHYYSNMNDWAEVFDCPIYIHQDDEPWIVNKGKQISLWKGGEKELWDGMKLIHVGGHFPGSAILQVPFLSAEGSIFCGDTLVLSPSKKHLSVMYSYPNRIPLPLHEVKRIKKLLGTISFDTYYGYESTQNVYGKVKEILEESFKRYFA